MVLLVTLVAGLLVVAESQASDVADRSNTQGFLSKPSGADASKNSLSDYGQFLTPNLKPSISTKDVKLPEIVDKEEMSASDNSTPMSLYAIGVGLLSLVTMLGARMRRGMQPANILAPGLGDNLMEMKSQPTDIGSPIGFYPLVGEAERNPGRIVMLAASQVEKCTGELKQQLTNIGAATVAFVPAAAHAIEIPTLVAPKESELIFTNPFFIAFFMVSLIGGLPVLAFLRLATVDEDEGNIKYNKTMDKSGLKNWSDDIL
jgi:hypothetical protein